MDKQRVLWVFFASANIIETPAIIIRFCFLHCCLTNLKVSCLFQGKRKVKYLIKHQVKLRHFTVTEGETGQQTINEDNSWGVEEDDGDVRIYLDC